jgi:hypothetical protein
MRGMDMILLGKASMASCMEKALKAAKYGTIQS